ncbi:MAG: tRNA uridine-5-carboxymethylaminomethyl(34) synthesis GTPase MnmE, partial [Syntrophomonadaceae bacterium]|nr:tRNA uridine-5-carboxymethylaminomethyl(34) synthesis GTPase MnmE [Syntrophomonadaceae bacterium]
MFQHENIAALATPPGEGGIGIIRTSGPGVIELIAPIFEAAGGRELMQTAGNRLV